VACKLHVEDYTVSVTAWFHPDSKALIRLPPAVKQHLAAAHGQTTLQVPVDGSREYAVFQPVDALPQGILGVVLIDLQ
jgi:hypothetical protein